jgi:hypothetical protein
MHAHFGMWIPISMAGQNTEVKMKSIEAKFHLLTSKGGDTYLNTRTWYHKIPESRKRDPVVSIKH